MTSESNWLPVSEIVNYKTNRVMAVTFKDQDGDYATLSEACYYHDSGNFVYYYDAIYQRVKSGILIPDRFCIVDYEDDI